jgi:adenylyltransferase/sulfurtransferase
MSGITDTQLLRYSRQIMLPEIDVAGQEQLLGAHVLIVGMGGLGSPAAMYLASAGVGKLTLCDHDVVEVSNLQRQIVHRQSNLGEPKVISAQKTLRELNPDVQIASVSHELHGDELHQAVSEADVVLDATDNFVTRYAINAACWQTATPLVSGAAIRWEGQLAVFDPRQPESPCYQCLYSEGDDNALNCSENGILGTVVGIIGTCQAMEAIKLITGAGEPLIGHVLYFDGKRMDWRKLRLSKNPNCPTCTG